MAQSAHLDRFVLDGLPPLDAQPDFLFDLPELRYPARLNAGHELLDRGLVCDWGARTALIFSGGEWSYAQLAAQANRIAHVLVEDLKLIPGARVHLRGHNGPMLSAAWLAILKAGCIAVVTMPMLRARELSYMLDKARADVSLCEDGLLDELEKTGAPHPVLSYSYDGRGECALERAMRDRPEHFAAVETFATDPALIAFTSGTTGAPKATVHFHRDILAIADCFPRSILETRADDIFLCSAPMAFTFGLGGALVFPLRYGAAAIQQPGGTPDRFLDIILERKPTIAMTAPTAYRAMAARAVTDHPASVRHYVSAGEHLPLATFERWRASTGRRIIDGIGATEMLHIFISAKPDDARPGATGRAISGYQATILNDALELARAGEVGRLAVKGPTGCRYFADARQKNYVAKRWNLTGDSFSMDEDGYFWFGARADDMIVSSGYNICGPEVEEAVLRHPAVLECAVVGAPDVERGQVVKAFVVAHKEHLGNPALAREIQDFVKAGIAPFKYPRAVEFVEALPRNASGKVQRFVLRQREIAKAQEKT